MRGPKGSLTYKGRGRIEIVTKGQVRQARVI
jgi:hypothetical protein